MIRNEEATQSIGMTHVKRLSPPPRPELDQPWALASPPGRENLVQSIRYDELLLEQVIHGARPPTISIQRHQQCLVATVRESRLANFARATQQLAAAGWPVAVRCTGGSCVPQGPGVLNLALIHPKVRGWTLEDGYRLLCWLLSQLVESYGLSAEPGEVPGSFCDGRYNLQVEGRKLVGTAQRWAGSRKTQGGILAHACLLVDLDLAQATGKINHLYRLCNHPQRFDPETCCSLRDCLPQSEQSTAAFVAGVEKRLTGLAGAYFGIPGHA